MCIHTTKPTYLEYIIAVCIEDHDALIKVVMFHGTRGVQNGQRRLGFRLEGVVRASVVQVVAQTSHEKSQHLEVAHEALHLPGFEHGEHGLGDVECVSPVVVFDRAIVFLHAEDPSTEDLRSPTKIIDKGLLEASFDGDLPFLIKWMIDG